MTIYLCKEEYEKILKASEELKKQLREGFVLPNKITIKFNQFNQDNFEELIKKIKNNLERRNKK